MKESIHKLTVFKIGTINFSFINFRKSMKESIHKLTVFKIGTPCLSIIIAKNIVPKNPMGFPKTS